MQLDRQEGDPSSGSATTIPADVSLNTTPDPCTCPAADPAVSSRRRKGNLPRERESNNRSHGTLQRGTADGGEARAVIEENVSVIHPRFTSVLKILAPLWLRAARGICRVKEAWIDGQGGGRDYLTFITVELIKKARSLFLSGE